MDGGSTFLGAHSRRRRAVSANRLALAPIRRASSGSSLTSSSHTAPPGRADPRDSLGYAVAEIRLGQIGCRRVFFETSFGMARTGDARRSSMSHPLILGTGSPDLDRDTEQPSLPRLWQTGLAGSGSVMVPVGVLYDTPENALAELQYFKNAGVTIDQVELGEEPDGQLVYSRRLRRTLCRVCRLIKSRFLGDDGGWPQSGERCLRYLAGLEHDQSWTSQFLKYLRARNAARTAWLLLL